METTKLFEPITVARQWLANFAAALYASDANAVAALFQSHGWFRDVLTFSWDNRTLEGCDSIVTFLSDKLPAVEFSDIKLNDDPYLRPKCFTLGRASGVEFGYTYETPIAHGKGYARLLQEDDSKWKGHTVSMIVMDLKGHEEPAGRYTFEAFVGGMTWGEYTSEQRAKWEADPHVIIIGGGQIGLQVAARFKQMSISHVLIERNNRIGDNWRKRYDSLALHTVKEQHQLLYQPHPTNWPVYPPRDRVASMLETYAMTQELLVWTNSSPVGRPVYDYGTQRWTMTIDRNGKEIVLHPAHIVLATGTLGAPRMPQLEGQNRFEGTVIHATQFKEPSPYKGQNVVVVGAGNSSVDICQDLAEGGAASVTMVQRSPMCVSGRDQENVRIGAAFSPDYPIEVNDFKVASIPRGYIVKMATSKQSMKEYWEVLHRDVLEKVQKGGYMVNLQKPQIALWFDRLGGYWFDKGAANLIASGDIKVIAGVEPKSFTEQGILLSDGSELSADAVIFATGYINMREVNKQLFGAEVIDKTHAVFGLDSEGEVSGSYRPSGYPGLWFAAGDFSNARFSSKHLAIQIKAIELGLMKY